MTTKACWGRRILALWSAPRSRSTAFFRMMLERGDFLAVHEPFSTLAEHGEADVHGIRVTTEAEVIAALRELSVDRPVFFKDTTDEWYPELSADRDFLARDVCSTFIIRDPAETITSYYAINPNVRLAQIGFEHLHRLYTAVRSVTGLAPVVVDSDDLVRSPGATAARYCAELGLSHDPSALTWTRGERPEWCATGKWHREVGETTGFEQRPPRHGVQLSDAAHLADYLAHHLPYYDKLREDRMVV